MRWLSLTPLLLIACGQTTTLTPGAECMRSSNCPVGQVCQDGACVAPRDITTPDMISRDTSEIVDGDDMGLDTCTPRTNCEDACGEVSDRCGGTLTCPPCACDNDCGLWSVQPEDDGRMLWMRHETQARQPAHIPDPTEILAAFWDDNDNEAVVVTSTHTHRLDIPDFEWRPRITNTLSDIKWELQAIRRTERNPSNQRESLIWHAIIDGEPRMAYLEYDRSPPRFRTEEIDVFEYPPNWSEEEIALNPRTIQAAWSIIEQDGPWGRPFGECGDRSGILDPNALHILGLEERGQCQQFLDAPTLEALDAPVDLRRATAAFANRQRIYYFIGPSSASE